MIFMHRSYYDHMYSYVCSLGDVYFITALDQKSSLEKELPSLKSRFESLGQKCRELQTKRKTMQAKLEQSTAAKATAMKPIDAEIKRYVGYIHMLFELASDEIC